jgi:GNAT superfamily N-acetyltransferase
MEQVNELKIRMITQEDLPAIVEIDTRIGGRERMPRDRAAASSHFWTYYQPLSFVCEFKGKIAGFVIGTVGGPEYSLPMCGWINIVGVDPEYQGQGVGKALVKHFIDTCQKEKIRARCVIPRKTGRFEEMLLALGFKHGELVDFVRDPQ